MLCLECTKAFATYIHDGRDKFEWFVRKRVRNFDPVASVAEPKVFVSAPALAPTSALCGHLFAQLLN
jgi:hypothetical protein